MQNPQTTLHLPPPPPEYLTGGDPLTNLATIQTQLDSLSHLLSNSLNSNTPLNPTQSNTISSQLSTAIIHVIINGASLISSSHNHPTRSNGHKQVNDKEDLEIIELDVDTLTADLSHVCEFCGKGFKRDANLRMHMRAHGDKFKTIQSLTKPPDNNNNNVVSNNYNGRKMRFSCPYVGCYRNKKHENFRPLKSAVCVKNHFKRFHCAKMFSCTKCKCKSFSVLADLKRHMKTCCDSTVSYNDSIVLNSCSCLCSCGVGFPTKDELFRHVSSSEGHMPAVSGGGGDFKVNEGGFIDDYDNGFGLIDDDQELRLWSSIEEFVQLF